MSVLLEFAMFPTSDDCRDGSSVSAQVSKIIDVIDKSGISKPNHPNDDIHLGR